MTPVLCLQDPRLSCTQGEGGHKCPREGRGQHTDDPIAPSSVPGMAGKSMGGTSAEPTGWMAA